MNDIPTPSRTRKAEPLHFACPTCRAVPGQPCDISGSDLKSHPQRRAYRHARVQPDRHKRQKGGWRKRVYSRLMIRHGEVCQQCGGCPPLQVDHKEALQFGGTNEIHNLWLLCIPCHKEKTSREQSERLKSLFAEWRAGQ